MVAAETLRIAVAGPEHVADRGGDHALEDRVALGDLEELVDGVAGPAAPRRRARDPDAHQPVDVLVGKRIEHDGVEDAVDRRRRHDARARATARPTP